MLTEKDLEKMGRLIDLKLHNALEPLIDRVTRVESEVRELRFDVNAIAIQFSSAFEDHEIRIVVLEEKEIVVN